MNETLLTKAEASYNIAIMIYKQMTGDEIYLNYVGYNLQQATELLIKYQIEMSGMTPRFTHNINMLIQFAKLHDINLQLDPFIIDKADTITTWEARTRYVLNYRVELDLINKALKAVGNTLKLLKSSSGSSANQSNENSDINTEVSDSDDENNELHVNNMNLF